MGYSKGLKLLVDTLAPYIDRMTDPNSMETLLRIGHIWYGEAGTTVTGVYYFANKNIMTAIPLRTESALSFSNSTPPTDSVQIEIIVHYGKFKTHIQKLLAAIQVSPVLPIINPLIAAITQPVVLNKNIYLAYGFKPDELTKRTEATELNPRAADALLMKDRKSVV